MTGIRRRLAAARADQDRGWVGVLLVLSVVMLFAVAGLVFDGGQALAARGEAANAARQAARAGADAMSLDALRGDGVPQVDPTVGVQAAYEQLAASGVDGEVSVAGDTVTVTAHVERPAVLLQAFGVSSLRGSATESAVAVRGVNQAAGNEQQGDVG